ncbi:hypothetical protein HZR84_09945 [Hyphobacterium sp. CCMP332]|nr:hypothetical protein HZR84_09945 [Hyphobacterium sp. CCMP332]
MIRYSIISCFLVLFIYSNEVNGQEILELLDFEYPEFSLNSSVSKIREYHYTPRVKEYYNLISVRKIVDKLMDNVSPNYQLATEFTFTNNYVSSKIEYWPHGKSRFYEVAYNYDTIGDTVRLKETIIKNNMDYRYIGDYTEWVKINGSTDELLNFKKYDFNARKKERKLILEFEFSDNDNCIKCLIVNRCYYGKTSDDSMSRKSRNEIKYQKDSNLIAIYNYSISEKEVYYPLEVNGLQGYRSKLVPIEEPFLIDKDEIKYNNFGDVIEFKTIQLNNEYPEDFLSYEKKYKYAYDKKRNWVKRERINIRIPNNLTGGESKYVKRKIYYK